MEQIYTAATKLVKTRLKRAEQALNDNDLTTAQNFFQSALEVGGDHPERADHIRQALKAYSQRISQEIPPDWRLAQEALEMLTPLALQNDETEEWWRNLKLNEASFLLSQTKTDESYKIFTNLVKTIDQTDVEQQLDLKISDIVRTHIAQYAAQEQWVLANQIIVGLRKLWLPNDNRQIWLETASHILNAAKQSQGADVQPQQPTPLIDRIFGGTNQQIIKEQAQKIKELENQLANKEQTIKQQEQMIKQLSG